MIETLGSSWKVFCNRWLSSEIFRKFWVIVWKRSCGMPRWCGQFLDTLRKTSKSDRNSSKNHQNKYVWIINKKYMIWLLFDMEYIFLCSLIFISSWTLDQRYIPYLREPMYYPLDIWRFRFSFLMRSFTTVLSVWCIFSTETRERR